MSATGSRSVTGRSAGSYLWGDSRRKGTGFETFILLDKLDIDAVEHLCLESFLKGFLVLTLGLIQVKEEALSERWSGAWWGPTGVPFSQ